MNEMLLAGGQATGLHPRTIGISHQLLPVHDKPTLSMYLQDLPFHGVMDPPKVQIPPRSDLGGLREAIAAGLASKNRR
jgi:glucose-1-phosphate thymidylyltransferase